MIDRIKMVLVLMIFAAVSATLLGWIQNYTKPIVEKNREVKLKQTVLNAFEIEYTDTSVLDIFNKNVDVFAEENMTYYRCFTEETEGRKIYTGTAVELSGPGFWAPIKIIVALSEDYETIIGFTVVEQEETPGLGGRMVEPWFIEQFKGKKVKPELRIISNRQGDNPNEVDAITGATETSKALSRILNNGMQNFFKELNK